MVEFEDQLDDNKVAEWTDSYVDYRKLNDLLKKAQRAADSCDALSRRRPELAAKVKAAYKAERNQGEEPTKPTSSDSERGGETAPLIGENVDDGVREEYGAKDAPDDSWRKNKSDSDYAAKLEQKMAEVDSKLDALRDCLFKERNKVSHFYMENVNSLEERLDVLVESVRSQYGPLHGTKDHPPRAAGTDRHTSVVQQALHRFQSLLTRKRDPQTRQLSDVGERYGGYESDEEAFGSDDSDMENIRELHSIRRALIDLYRTSQLLNNYSMMNYVAIMKIRQKFKKAFPDKKLMRDGEELLRDPDQYMGRKSERLGYRMEKIYAEAFCYNDVRRARSQMLPKKGDGLKMDWSQVRLGYRLGMCAILTLWVCWDCIWGHVATGQATIGGRTAFPVFRACGGLLLLHWFWGCSVAVWRRYRINYIYLFEFKPTVVDDPLVIFNYCVDETLVFLIIMLLYYKTGSNEAPGWIPTGLYPFFLVLYTAKTLIFPLRTRAPMWGAILRVVTAPITSPKFFHTYVADVFTSLVKVFLDVLWTLCFVFSGDFLISEDEVSSEELHQWQHARWYKDITVPVICLLPLVFRFAQCLRRYIDTGKRCPNLANATKYAMSQTVTLFGAFHPLYLLHSGATEQGVKLFQLFWKIMFVSSSLFSYFWDVYMDWGLGRPKYWFLGPRLMFPNKFHYYSVMAADLVLRFMWVQSLIPPHSGANFEIPAYLTAANMSLELLRRTLWGFFRLEKEHRSNTEGYRDINFVPLHFSTGHSRKYKKDRERVGRHVLVEVFFVSAVVIVVSFLSVIAAQKAAAPKHEL